MKKKVFMFLLSLTMCSSVLPQVSVFANQISNTEEYTSSINDVIFKQIEDIEDILIKNILSDENIVLGDVSIAEPIKIVNTNRYMFPVLNDNEIIKFIEVENVEGEYFISIGSFFAEKLNELSNNNYVIFENIDGNIFATDGKQQFLLNNDKDTKNTYSNQDFTKEFENNFINISSNKVIYDINEVQLKNSIISQRSGSWNYQYPIVKQSGSQSCWAACMSSILKGLGMNYSENDVLRNANKTNNQTADSSEVKSFFRNYGIYASTGYGPLTESSLSSEIRNGRAIWQAMYNFTKREGHAVVIYGYENKGTLWVSIMDPGYGQRYDCLVSSGRFRYDGKESTEYLYNLD